MSVLDAVLAEVRTGARPGAVAARLGIDPGLAEAALDHWVRLGVVTPASALALGCGGCGTTPGVPARADVPARAGAPATPVTPAPACRGCPLGGAR